MPTTPDTVFVAGLGYLPTAGMEPLELARLRAREGTGWRRSLANPATPSGRAARVELYREIEHEARMEVDPGYCASEALAAVSYRATFGPTETTARMREQMLASLRR